MSKLQGGHVPQCPIAGDANGFDRRSDVRAGNEIYSAVARSCFAYRARKIGAAARAPLRGESIVVALGRGRWRPWSSGLRSARAGGPKRIGISACIVIRSRRRRYAGSSARQLHSAAAVSLILSVCLSDRRLPPDAASRFSPSNRFFGRNHHTLDDNACLDMSGFVHAVLSLAHSRSIWHSQQFIEMHFCAELDDSLILPVDSPPFASHVFTTTSPPLHRLHHSSASSYRLCSALPPTV